MNETKYLKCACAQCGGHIEFPAEAVEVTVACPHCGRKTALSEPQAAKPKNNTARWMLAFFAVLILAGGGGFVYFQKPKNQKDSSVPNKTGAPANSSAKVKPLETTNSAAISSNNLRVGKITLEKTRNSSVVYAVGAVKNESDRERFGLKVELDLLDSNGERIGTATDYLSILEPRQDWRFKAMVLEGKAVGARLAAIREDQ